MVDGMQMCSHRVITAGTESSSSHEVSCDKDRFSVPSREGHLFERF